jgi:hypothetical protein
MATIQVKYCMINDTREKGRGKRQNNAHSWASLAQGNPVPITA